MLGFLTSRRLGALVPLKGSDITLKYAAYSGDSEEVSVFTATIENWIDGDGNICTPDLKTEVSRNSFVLHSVLEEIGFIAWVQSLESEPIFSRFFLSADPTSYASKVQNQHFKSNGCIGGEVFHSTRGDGISRNRSEIRIEQAVRHQSGHAQLDEHSKYGSKLLPEKIAREFASAELPRWLVDLIPLMKAADFSAMRNAEFAEGEKNKRSRK